MRLLVIGGTGFVTGALVNRARAQGHEVICAHRRAGPGQVRCDARTLAAARDPLRAVAPDAVVHGVCYGRTDADQLLAVFDDRPLIVLSSMDRYESFGRAVRGEATGPHPTRDDSPRGTDFAMQRAAKGIDDYDKNALVDRLADRAAVLHLPMVYGPADHQVAHRHGPAIYAALHDEPMVLGMAEAERLWTFGYVDDMAEACLHALRHGVVGSYNVGEDRVRTLAEWAQLYGAEVTRVPDPWVGTEGPQPHLIVDSTRFGRDTGFVEPVGPEEGAARTLAWHRTHGIDAPDDRAARQEAARRWHAIGP